MWLVKASFNKFHTPHDACRQVSEGVLKMADPLASHDTTTSISKKTYLVAGISTTVFGLDELPAEGSEVACLWLLHPRLATQERMTAIGAAAITDWNSRVQDGRAPSPVKGLIAVSFDQRNHGSRMIDPIANEGWRQGNPKHAQDMFSIFRKFGAISSTLLPGHTCPLCSTRATC